MCKLGARLLTDFVIVEFWISFWSNMLFYGLHYFHFEIILILLLSVKSEIPA